MTVALRQALLDGASAPYRAAGRFAWHFSRAKLKRDPVFVGLLEHGIIPDARRLVDLGCGQGLLVAWLRTARAQFDAGRWRSEWPPPPDIGCFFGLELMHADVERARRALDGLGEFQQGDIRTAEFGEADVVIILDVLHFLAYDEQVAVLRRVREALPPHGMLVTRIGDAQGGLRFRLSQWVDHAVSFMRGHRRPRNFCRTRADWIAVLQRLGFQVDALPMSERTPFANVLLIARVSASASGLR